MAANPTRDDPRLLLMGAHKRVGTKGATRFVCVKSMSLSTVKAMLVSFSIPVTRKRQNPLVPSVDIRRVYLTAFERCPVHHLVEVRGVPEAQASLCVALEVVSSGSQTCGRCYSGFPWREVAE